MTGLAIPKHHSFASRAKKLFIGGVATIVAVGTGMTMVASAVTPSVVVTPDSLQGWTSSPPVADTRPGGSVTFTEEFGAPSGFGDGSLKVATTDGSAKAQMVHGVEPGTLLSDVDDIAYSTYRSSSSTGSAAQVASINVAVDVNGDAAGGFTTLVFEPVYQVDAQGPIVNDTWQNWDGGDSSIWWSSNPIPGAPNRDTFVTLASLKASNPDAVVLGFGINQGSGNPGIVSGVDALTFNGTTYDFELVAPLPVAPTAKEECKDGGWKNFQTAYKNQGQCVAAAVSNENSKHHR